MASDVLRLEVVYHNLDRRKYIFSSLADEVSIYKLDFIQPKSHDNSLMWAALDSIQ